MSAPDPDPPLVAVLEHIGGCDALCADDRHYLIHDPVAVDESPAPLGDGWVEVGYTDADGVKPPTWGGIVANPKNCAYCAVWPAIPCAVHRTRR